MTKSEECKAKTEALRWVLDMARRHADDAHFDYEHHAVIYREDFEEEIERELVSLKAQARADAR